MDRRVIPFEAHRRPETKADGVHGQRTVLISVTLIVLHLVSLAVALTYF